MTQIDICSVITARFAKLKYTKNDMSAIRQMKQMQCFLGQIRGEILKCLYSCHDNTFFDASKIFHVYEDRSAIEISRITDTVNITLDFAYDPVGRINVTISALGKDVTNRPGNIDIRQIDGLPYLTSQQWTSNSLDGKEIGRLIQNFVTLGEMQQQSISE